MKLPRQFFLITGSALVIASFAMAGVSFSVGSPEVIAFGDCVPTSTPDPVPNSPTPDPSLQSGINTENDLSAAGVQCTPTEETPPKTHTPTADATDEPDPTEPPTTATRAPSTSVPANTPSGGAGAGGLQPPNTGTGSDADSGMQWLLMAGGLIALTLGAGALGFGLRRNDD